MRILTTLVLLSVSALGLAASAATPALTPSLDTYVRARIAEFDQIPPERRAALDQLACYIRSCARANRPCRLVFICTHNSRRSHMGQVWATVAGAWYETEGLTAYSGGTESTAFNPRAVDALRRAGLIVEQTTHDTNPIYHVRFSQDEPAITCFSKVYDHEPNPRAEFAAVMTCADAAEACPVVFGADARIAIPYLDPKTADGSKLESQTYDERCAQIAREMLYAFALASAQD